MSNPISMTPEPRRRSSQLLTRLSQWIISLMDYLIGLSGKVPQKGRHEMQNMLKENQNYCKEMQKKHRQPAGRSMVPSPAPPVHMSKCPWARSGPRVAPDGGATSMYESVFMSVVHLLFTMTKRCTTMTEKLKTRQMCP